MKSGNDSFKQIDSESKPEQIWLCKPHSRYPAKARRNTDDYILIIGTLHHKHFTNKKVNSGIPSDHKKHLTIDSMCFTKKHSSIHINKSNSACNTMKDTNGIINPNKWKP